MTTNPLPYPLFSTFFLYYYITPQSSSLFMKKFVAKVPSKKAAAPAAASKSAASKPSAKRGALDFTWGGRPNPTPETFVEEVNFFNAPWRYNKPTR